MKSLLASKFLLATLPLVSTTALAHSGHMADASIHSFLHVEHVMILAVIGLVACMVKVLRNK